MNLTRMWAYFDILHHQVIDAALVAHIVERADVPPQLEMERAFCR